MYSMIILVGLLRMLHVTTADTAPEAPSAGAYLDRCQLAGHDGGIKSGHVTVHSDENSPPPKYRERNCLAPSMAIAEEPKKYSVSMFPAEVAEGLVGEHRSDECVQPAFPPEVIIRQEEMFTHHSTFHVVRLRHMPGAENTSIDTNQAIDDIPVRNWEAMLAAHLPVPGPGQARKVLASTRKSVLYHQ
eukprot:CAMPEP_0114424552 /NCGR_PEP_ID=MMETSP0103-20121206/6756_1 /TAXON_ID=37642 ORGANISM="Paraphysomonas imperforata, Strain PA2" /NCGR_SAMPLE_ID=MMETSP0103 /ASSEMBLY_ACC=CAM_ASM_000201 /LENGTH=187 /DNA_ID=CAMNT_0001593315 /DNA_START=267 /DNA_END=829 /DNA_ORIENTATION=+